MHAIFIVNMLFRLRYYKNCVCFILENCCATHTIIYTEDSLTD